MEFKLRYEIGQTVFRDECSGLIISLKIEGVEITHGYSSRNGDRCESPRVLYSPGLINEKWLFATHEEAKASVIRRAERRLAEAKSL